MQYAPVESVGLGSGRNYEAAGVDFFFFGSVVAK